MEQLLTAVLFLLAVVSSCTAVPQAIGHIRGPNNARACLTYCPTLTIRRCSATVAGSSGARFTKTFRYSGGQLRPPTHTIIAFTSPPAVVSCLEGWRTLRAPLWIRLCAHCESENLRTRASMHFRHVQPPPSIPIHNNKLVPSDGGR